MLLQERVSRVGRKVKAYDFAVDVSKGREIVTGAAAGHESSARRDTLFGQ